ncbi:MAG: 3-deoxy-D-manno-octulosonic acid transferase [Planctomycetaceae bacterium]
MPWILNLAYIALLLIVSPVLLYRRWVLGKYRDGWAEKLWGQLPERRGDKPCLWLHAVSVGEVLQLRPMMKLLATQRPDWEFVITTTTRTGLDVAKKEYPQHTVCYFPLDFSWATYRAISRIRPSAIVLVELELWPNFILTANRLDIPLALINGRVSAKSFRGYRRVRPLIARLLNCFDLLAAQNQEYADRLLALGAPRERLHITGSIKFDGVQSNRSNARTTELREFFGLRPEENVFIAGSTQAPEEAFALDTWQTLRGEFPNLRLILVPRHKERFEEVAALVVSRGWPLLRRSTGSVPAPGQVLLLDTLGELGACWGLADIAFVGGSLTRRGGQNMLEPAGYGAAVLLGPNTWNFRDIVEQLLSRDAARVVRSEQEMTHAVRELLKSPALAQELGERAKTFVATQQGAAARTVELLRSLPIRSANALLERRAA